MFFFIANTLNSLKCFDATLFCISLFFYIRHMLQDGGDSNRELFGLFGI